MCSLPVQQTLWRLLLIAYVLSFPQLLLAAPDHNRPNILFILTDDQRWDTLGCYGNEVIRTPNLDRFASEGARLDAFYVASPVCAPSRAVFLSGLYPHQTGILWNLGRLDFSEGTDTVATYLNQAGYVTGFVGKAHLGGYPYKWHFKDCPVFLPGWGSRHENPALFLDGRRSIVKGYVTEIFTDAAIDFLERHKKDRWFLWLATTAPHIPYLQDSKQQYPKSKIKPPPGWSDPGRFPFTVDPSDVSLTAEEKKWAGNWSDYYATISMLDEQIGRVLRKLEDLNLANETFVFVTSDNGVMKGSHNEPAKEVWYEESVRVPALVRWPGKIRKGTVVPYLLSSADFLPTLLELAGLPKDKKLEGRSILPSVISGRSVRENVFSEVKREQGKGYSLWRMVRTNNWKYVRIAKHEFLFDLTNDPHELSNLAVLPASVSAMEIMRKKMDSWLQQTPSPPRKLSYSLLFFLRWLHVIACVLWIGGVSFSIFEFRQITFSGSRSGTGHIDPVVVRSILIRQWQIATIAFLTGIAMFCAQYCYPDRLLFINENGLTVRGLLILIGMILGFVQWLSTRLILAAVSRRISQDLDDLFVRRISTALRLIVLLSFPTLLCMLAASHEISDGLAKMILVLVGFALCVLPVYLYAEFRIEHFKS